MQHSRIATDRDSPWMLDFGPTLLPPRTIGIIPASAKADLSAENGTLVERGGNGEQQIEVACRSADTRQDARAASAPHSSAAWIAKGF
jgi:hypothetical protein